MGVLDVQLGVLRVLAIGCVATLEEITRSVGAMTAMRWQGRDFLPNNLLKCASRGHAYGKRPDDTP